ncbi:DUF2357 domain-containing protein [uncultured Bacteroides sp.]|uniref:DUF2357 domain-containing protein n=1 Tax=uncultured Bacteroides sp. TaxID=162156 RepID=UPI002595BE5B|nr:DUF2357 domain-containing protein [uncultured Bacteroides sp.]
MELLQYTYNDAYIFQVSSTDIEASWRKFKVRARQLPPERYCSYGMKEGGTLSIWNADKREMEIVPKEEWNESRPIFFEDHKYTLSFTFFDAQEQPRIIHPNKEVEQMFNCVHLSSGEYLINSNIDFLNQPGHFALEFAYINIKGNHIQHKVEFDVLSPKLDTKHDLDIIIQQIRQEYGDLVFRYLTLTFQQFEIGKEANNELIWLSVFKQIVDNYIQAVRYILHQPHNKMQALEEYRRAERIKAWTPQLSERFVNDRLNNEQKALRTYYRTQRIEATLDTRENRFVKYTLERIIERLSLLIKRLSEGTSDSERKLLKEKQQDLIVLKNSTFFNGIGSFDGFRQQSMVLQQRNGYAQVYRYWIMLQNGLDLIQGDTSVGVQPIWKLYELWCFLKVKQLVCKVLGINPQNKEHIQKYIHEDTRNAFDLFNGGSLSGNITYINPQNEDLVEVGYQYSFNRKAREDEMRSATTEQKPDIVMHIHKHKRDITLTYLYDAKYRVKGDGDEQINSVIDEPVAETLDAMHHYRDAIYYGKKGEKRFSKEIIGGYILFPGRMDEAEMSRRMKDGEKLPYYLQSIDEVNIGAYPLLPNEKSGLLLEEHLHKVLIGETIIEQLKDSVPQRGLKYKPNIDNSPILLIGYAKPNVVNHIIKNGMYYIPIMKDGKTYPINPDYDKVKYLLLHTSSPTKRFLFAVEGKPKSISGAEILEMGYPSSAKPTDLYMAYMLKGERPHIEGFDIESVNLGSSKNLFIPKYRTIAEPNAF